MTHKATEKSGGAKPKPHKVTPKTIPDPDKDESEAPPKHHENLKSKESKTDVDDEQSKKKASETKKLLEELEHTSIDLSGEEGKRLFCKRLHESLSPLSKLLTIIGRFPVTNTAQNDDGTFEYEASCSSMNVFHFNITSLILLYTFGVGTLNILRLTLNFRRPKDMSLTNSTHVKQWMHDQALIHRHVIPLIIVFTALFQGCLSSIFFTVKRYYLAHIFGFINKAAYTLHMDIAGSVTDFTLQSTVFCVVVTCVFIMLGSLKFGPSSSGTPLAFGSLLVRLYLGSRSWLEFEPNSFGSRQLVGLIGGFFLIIVYVSSIAPMLLFIYKCKILRKALACWNGRAYCTLLRGLEFAQTEDTRTTYNLLFKDHCVLLDLVDSVDQMYAFTIESFFLLQFISLLFQLYFFFRTGSQGPTFIPYASVTYEKNYFYVRPYDWIPALLILFTTSVLLYACCNAASNVGEEAEAGFEVLRRKGVIGRRTDQELEFMFSMSFSFSNALKKCEISGAGYFYYNKGFMLHLFAVALFCFMIMLQYKPFLEYYPQPFSNNTGDTFLRVLEGSARDAAESVRRNETSWRLRH